MKEKIKISLVFGALILFFITIYISGYSKITEDVPGFLFVVLFIILISGSFSVLLFNYHKKIEKERREFIAIINHVFRTPLTQIEWTLEQMEDSFVSGEQKKEISKIKSSTRRLLNIFEAFAGLTKYDDRGAYSFKAVEFHEIVQDALRNHQAEIEKKDLILSVDLDTELPLVTVDIQKLSFAIEVLIENAIVYSFKGGLINVELKKEGNQAIMKVTDRGIGIDRHSRSYIFSEFYRGEKARTAHPDGMGLGLFLAQKIVKQHKGEVKIEPNPKGVTAWIKIPLEK
jgi:signal transduction histidine kinase